jgi:hypothetical protein
MQLWKGMDEATKRYAPIGNVTDLELGKAAEHLVVADLILQGYRAYLSDQGLPYDVVVDLGGWLIRLQVKATRCLRSVPQRSQRLESYLFHTRRAGKGGKRRYSAADFDMLALVALDVRVVAYMPFVATIPGCLYLRPIGAQPAKHATRIKNIDGFPFAKAAEALGPAKKEWREMWGKPFDWENEKRGRAEAAPAD